MQVQSPPDETHLPLTFEFPEGELIGIAKEKLPVVVSFANNKSMSFTANVVFLDEEGKRFNLPITGTTDNSLLTIKPFIEVRLCICEGCAVLCFCVLRCAVLCCDTL